MNNPKALRAGIPAIYAAAILIGFLISTTVGVIVLIGGAMLGAIAYTMIARAAAPANGRNRDRNR